MLACTQKVWKAPKVFEFDTGGKTMRAPCKPVVHDSVGFTSNHPTCPHCKGLARPAILMFCDSQWIPDSNAKRRYSNWKNCVGELLAENKDLKVVVLEIGCGIRVPTVRFQSERYVSDLPAGQCTLIRVNPDYPMFKGSKHEHVISIRSSGLPAIRTIDKNLQALLSAKSIQSLVPVKSEGSSNSTITSTDAST